MFFILSKILFYILMPATLIACILIFAIVTKNEKRKKIALYTCLFLFLFFGNIGITNQFFLLWEPEPIALSKLQNYDLGIVLTGVTNHDKEPHDRVYFNKGADRVLHTVQLYKMGKLKKILITGGSGRINGEGISEATDMKKVFLLCGVPDSVLILELNSRNTRENALFTKKMIDSLNLKGSKLLITSAFHMPRSKACFDKVGLKTDIFPTDFSGGAISYTPDVWIVPSENAFVGWHVLFHEWIGYLMYLVMGYV
jgi:uncharacterized SAM-binding protein YcdF (DUF218 family)